MSAALQGNSGPLDALRTPRRDLPLLGAGDTPHRQAALRAGRHARAVHHTVCIHGAWPGSHPQDGITHQEAL